MTNELKCFISASIDTDTYVIKNILHENNVDTFDSYDFQVGDFIKDTIIRKIRESDFVIVVLNQLDPNIIFEMGISEGAGKPVFVISSKDTLLPYFAEKYPHVTTAIKDTNLLRIALGGFIDDLISNTLKTSKKLSMSKRSYQLDTLRNYLNQINNLRRSGKVGEIEQLVQHIFSDIGLSYSADDLINRKGRVDFAIWNNNLGSIIGNPLFIEVKFGTLTPELIHKSESQLRDYITNSEAKAGILLYLDRHGKRFKSDYTLSPLILRYDIEDFLKELIDSSFEDTILRKRNMIVHGVQDE